LAAEIAVERFADAIDDRGVGLQPHVAPQPLVEHSRDQPPFAGEGRFLLDDRRERQGLVLVLQQ
jgi:hypothetical protein